MDRARVVFFVASCVATTAFASTIPCPNASKMAFAQDTGCLNDGSVEFCVPRADEELRHRLIEFSLALRDTDHSGGRARCTHDQTLFHYETPGYDSNVCRERHGRLSDAAWKELCTIASEPAITRIVPTWYE